MTWYLFERFSKHVRASVKKVLVKYMLIKGFSVCSCVQCRSMCSVYGCFIENVTSCLLNARKPVLVSHVSLKQSILILAKKCKTMITTCTRFCSGWVFTVLAPERVGQFWLFKMLFKNAPRAKENKIVLLMNKSRLIHRAMLVNVHPRRKNKTVGCLLKDW